MFIRSFLDGVPRSSFAKGFTRRYHLGSCEVTFEAFGSRPDDVAAYRNACLSALQKPRKPDLAFVITSEKQEALRGNDSPYLVCKSVFMGQGVPVQNIQIETVRGDGLAYPLDSIALASYAKLGGTPYVIAAAAAMTQELVIGIGSAHVGRPGSPTPNGSWGSRPCSAPTAATCSPTSPGKPTTPTTRPSSPVAGDVHRACQGTQRLAAGGRAPAHLPCLQAAEGHRGQGRERPRPEARRPSTRRSSSPSSP